MKQTARKHPKLDVFNQMESEVRSYCRSFQTVFSKASNAILWDKHHKAYIDFFAGAGALNYGHNNPRIREKLVQYLLEDGVTHSLDMATEAKENFLLRFHHLILRPRSMSYKIMFPGPTGTNAVESALKIARKVTGRTNIICFTNAFHGMSLGSLSATGNSFKRKGAGVTLGNTTFMPYDQYFGSSIDTSEMLDKLLDDPGSGIDKPAAVLLETLQGEGGLHAASTAWLQKIENICRKHGMLLIVDDVQMGCGRTGTFFSFEEAQINPDLICLSKSIGGYGLPMALTLIKPEYDQWEPGEHNGTFRGNNLGFIAASEALEYWTDHDFTKQLTKKSEIIRSFLLRMLKAYPHQLSEVRGKGLIQGLAFVEPAHAGMLSAEAFDRGVILETSGPRDEVAKIMPPLTIEEKLLHEGLERIEDALHSMFSSIKMKGKVSANA
ncbi:diaminobutyrate--2-oxoglutarate transaminase [Paenibacillus sp. 1001270B_150601_E10]|uniref:diaminobutyrate--2-oxoglutarate transaminase n=1 Tax=Paenibacillus sp. 1001270B_150601_E10 TaxID=2787079 RepID=UPI00226CF4E6|nr:diaminobutyrate--2-oxoglutarate transaminase [Paenibacillus sp. 1001270B_150601_E10]